eukprot:scaffold153177_cov35-Tisochrysis_lutea.AAC.2
MNMTTPRLPSGTRRPSGTAGDRTRARGVMCGTRGEVCLQPPSHSRPLARVVLPARTASLLCLCIRANIQVRGGKE